MKICKRGLNFVQVTDAHGTCRMCSWSKNNIIGSLLNDSLSNIYKGEKATFFRSKLIDNNYEDCPTDNCPFLANGTIEDNCIEIDEIPEYPSELFLAFEGNCNYNCTCCTSYMNMRETAEKDWSSNYEKIEKSIEIALPYVKKISANGRGELFCSKRILGILANWKPLSPIDEISVSLETNGSLFNERNWEKIKNLGQYNLSVSITVMSFKEDVYQFLSGTQLPISNIIRNLLFVKKLREEGMINHLELATVMQEQNFREMPEFTKRCIEEFGADSVRIRPIMPGGPMDVRSQWFMDVRNPYHPYYKEYKKVMQHEIFKHPKVLLWSGDLDSNRGGYPGERDTIILNMMQDILTDNLFLDKLASRITISGAKRLWIYGVGKITKTIIRLNSYEQKINADLFIDNYYQDVINGMKIYKASELDTKNSEDVGLLITVLGYERQIEQEMINLGFGGTVIKLNELLEI